MLSLAGASAVEPERPLKEMGLDSLMAVELRNALAKRLATIIIAGVIGGLISFGVLGLFVGPVILAATYTLARDWVNEARPDDILPT